MPGTQLHCKFNVIILLLLFLVFLFFLLTFSQDFEIHLVILNIFNSSVGWVV